MSGNPTNLYDVMIAMINTYKPYDEEGAKNIAKMYRILRDAV